ncbi:hypothetical protein WG66_002455 [Moniliophthora roreri]|nr:hypothetical protein WG66_002455 [Moniliophthora roreri]
MQRQLSNSGIQREGHKYTPAAKPLTREPTALPELRLRHPRKGNSERVDGSTAAVSQILNDAASDSYPTIHQLIFIN